MKWNEFTSSEKFIRRTAFLGLFLFSPIISQAQAEQQILKLDAHALESPEPYIEGKRFIKLPLSSRDQVSDSVLSEFKLPDFTSIMGFEIGPGHFFYHLGLEYDIGPLNEEKLLLFVWEDAIDHSGSGKVFFAFDGDKDNQVSKNEVFESKLGEDRLVFLKWGSKLSFKLPILINIDKVWDELSVDITNVLVSSGSFQLDSDKIDAYFYHSPFLSRTYIYKNGELVKNGKIKFFEFNLPFLINDRWYNFSTFNPLESTVTLNKLDLGELPFGDREGCYINFPKFKSILMEKDSLRWIDFSNKYFVLHFWGAWCKPCVNELPDVKALEMNLSELENVQLLHVALLGGTRENSQIDKLVFKYQLLAPHYLENLKDLRCYEGNNKYSDGCSLSSIFNNSSFPTYYVIDDTGKILFKGKLNEGLHDKIVELDRTLDK